MKTRPTVVILPGLDGTGRLLRDFTDALMLTFRVQVIAYPSHPALGYGKLIEFIDSRLPSNNFILIGESFSGPLALMLSHRKPQGLRAVVLGASFARLDMSCKAGLRILSTPILAGRIPVRLLSPILLGSWSNAEQRETLGKALAQVSPDVLALRAREALSIDLPRTGIRSNHPLLYLRPTRDMLMPSTAVASVQEVASDCQIRDIEAPHFLFQAAPDACADAIRSFVHEKELSF